MTSILLLSAFVSAMADTKITFTVEGKGEFVMSMNEKAAPKTCARIIQLAQSGFYNGLKFHRAEKKPRPYLVQVGDPATRNAAVNPEENYLGGSGQKLAYEESGLENVLGAVGLAGDSAKNNQGDSQFYILLSTSRFLNGKFTVFANITKGMDVVQSIDRGDKIVSAKVTRD
jgi:cyclophilin family peptidyl-prolyl cis-trans isomerase